MGTARELTTVALLVAAPLAASAQSAQPDARWEALFGCWEPASATQEDAPALRAESRLTCVVPVQGSAAVDMVDIVDGKITQRRSMLATGERVQTKRDGCEGWESGEWAPSGTRVFLQTGFTCPGGIERRSNGVMDISASGDWIVVEGIAAGSSQGVQVSRYVAATRAGTVPAEVLTALEGHRLSSSTARLAATRQLTLADVADATSRLEAVVVESWLLERNEGFDLNARQLEQLSEAGVPPGVIDVMLALSYPDALQIEGMTPNGDPVVGQAVDQEIRRTYWDPFYGPRYGYGGYFAPYGYYSPYGYSRYGFGLSPFGFGYHGGWRSVVVVRGSSTPSPRGKAVQGRGYTRSGGASVRGSRPATTGSRAGASTSRSSGKSAKGGSTRTARKKP